MTTTIEQALLQVLRQEYDAFQEFSALLERECKALTSGMPDALTAVVSDKEVAAETLQRLSLERCTLLTGIGVNIENKQSVNSWFNEHSAQDPLRLTWTSLLEIGRRVNEQNIHNGKMIARRLESTQESLYILKKAAASSALYGPDGKIQSPFAKRYSFG